MARITQQELARKIGVSRSTVALALHPDHAEKLSPAVRQKVLAAARKWNYRPDRYARIMRGGKSGIIGVFHFGGLQQVAAERTFHADMAIRDAGYELMSFDVSWSADSVAVAIESMKDARVEGAVVAGLNDPSLAAAFDSFRKDDTPIVALSGNPLPFAPHFRGDARLAYHQLTHHLLDSGRRRLALVTHAADTKGAPGAYSWAGRERILGFREAIENAGGKVVASFSRTARKQPEGVILSIGLPEDPFDPFARGARGMEELLSVKVIPEAILCEDDEVAIGALSVARQAGISVPDGMAITGYDHTAAGSYCEVPLTTVRQPNRQMAERAVEILLEWINGKPPAKRAQTELFPCELIERASSAAR